MAAPRPSSTLERAIQRMVEAREPAERAQVLLQAVRGAFGAHAAALCRPRHDGSWAHYALLGEAQALPPLDQVAAVVDGSLPRYLPPERAVFVASAELALVLGGIVEDVKVDGIDALLLVYATMSAQDRGPAGLEEVRRPLPPAWSPGDVLDLDGEFG